MKNISLLTALKEDHRKIRECSSRLQKCAGLRGASAVLEDKCWKAFEEFREQLLSHAKAEEQALYDFFANAANPLAKNKTLLDLKLTALESSKEHEVIEQLVHELNDFVQIDDEWRAQAKVCTEMLDHHLSEEESHFFPIVAKVTSHEALVDMGTIYHYEHRRILKGLKEGDLMVENESIFTRIRDFIASAAPNPFNF